MPSKDFWTCKLLYADPMSQTAEPRRKSGKAAPSSSGCSPLGSPRPSHPPSLAFASFLISFLTRASDLISTDLGCEGETVLPFSANLPPSKKMKGKDDVHYTETANNGTFYSKVWKLIGDRKPSPKPFTSHRWDIVKVQFSETPKLVPLRILNNSLGPGPQITKAIFSAW